MRLIELWWLIEAHAPPVMYGSMSEAEVSEIYEEAYGDGGR